MTIFRIVAVYAVLLMFPGTDARLWAEETKTTTTYAVPTTGEIMDVMYLPEFDEWWVKCREGKGVSVYSYDKRSKKWGQALFLPEKAVEKSKSGTRAKTDREPEKPDKTVSPGTAVKGEDRPSEKSKSDGVGPDGASVSSSQEQGGGDSGAKKKKWWDPLDLLKGDKKPVSPSDKPLP
ncbi:MAG: hypothetical protein V1792_23185 [Pseudomonadota bacterium]